MDLKLRLNSLSVVMGIGLVGFIAGCPFFQPPVDLCAGVQCDDGFACDSDTGDCVPTTVDLCAGVQCDDGFACDPDTGDCVPTTVDLCAGVECNDGFACDPDTGDCVPTTPQGFLDANEVRGGSLYDKWWTVAEVDAPTDDHPFWAMQDTNTRTGADTWRCKECHGWDYKGADGAYGPSNSHYTGFTGIFGTALSAQEVFDKIKTGHGFGDAGLADTDVWDLAKFVLDGGQRDTDDIIDVDGAFIGDAANGDTLYNGGIAGGLACMICHGADGQTLNFKDPPDEEFIGGLANGNPWEFQHKVWYGHPGTPMPAAANDGGTAQDVADVGAHSQTLP